ncbi:putative interleukin-17D-like [Apostichopus japonicus]|uniref:Putative interleukin-17D-like n=2 Tax=Stichopus japonicus TaxID=307972 RepID=A0A2G8JK18_STIJA|nr:putative interleukin-17D-like [Apostichopus japonicus]
MITSWFQHTLATPTPNTLPCTFQEQDVRQRYLRTRHELYPFQLTFGVEALVGSDNIPNWYLESYSTDAQTRSCREGIPPRKYLVDPMSNSMCPWYYENEYEADRFPAVISKARCRCVSCLNPITSRLDRHLTCRPIKYRMNVLKLSGCVEGLLKYNVTTIDVPVACACMRNTIESHS